MMRENNINNDRRKESVDRVVKALSAFFQEHNTTNTPVFASTRDIANRSELSIYNARHILIKLEKEGVITSSRKDNSKCLYWNKTEYFKD